MTDTSSARKITQTENLASDLNTQGSSLKSGASPTKVDIRAIMTEIRTRVKADIEANRDSGGSLKTFSADSNARAARKAGELQRSSDLLFLNQNFDSCLKFDANIITSHRPGFLGKIIVSLKRKVLGALWGSLLRNLFFSQREFNASLTRYLNDLSQYVDSRDASNFWELIRKVDYDITKAMDRIERVADEQSGSLRSSEKGLVESINSAATELSARIAKLDTTVSQHGDSLRTLDSVSRGLERIVANINSSSRPSVESITASSVSNIASPTIDYSYVLLENRFRGSQEEISKRLGIYTEYYLGAANPVLEIGAGRGELQELFNSSGIPSYGVDLDSGMVEAAKERGLDVRIEDGIAHLAALDDASLGGVIAVQVVEHLTREQLSTLFGLCAKKVVPGGKIIFETINPKSVTALSSNYFRDPTHVFPLHPDTLGFSLTLSGLEVVETRFLSPIPQEARLREMSVGEFMTPRWIETISLFNHNIRQLNDLLYGYQDYCIVAKVPSK